MGLAVQGTPHRRDAGRGTAPSERDPR